MRTKNFKQLFASSAMAASLLLGNVAPVSVLAHEDVATSYVAETEATVDMLRLYNPNSGEHFYTGNASEKDSLVAAGWQYEGIGWVSPTEGSNVYRLYNPNTGDHHYTTNAAEKDNLVNAGWKYEGVCWESGGEIPCYRVYNPNARGAGSHHYTTSQAEAKSLVAAGWKDEGIGWMVAGYGQTITPPAKPSQPSQPVNPSNPVQPSNPGGSNVGNGLNRVSEAEAVYTLNTNTHKFHHPYCKHAKSIHDNNVFYTNSSREAVINAGYVPCKVCKP